ncbi:hypothetical protein D3C81_1869790 [compost metagenome]
MSIDIDWEEARNIVGWIAGCAMAVLIAWAPVKCTMDSNAKVAEAIEQGANPIDAACAYSSNMGSSSCIVRAAMTETDKKAAK